MSNTSLPVKSCHTREIINEEVTSPEKSHSFPSSDQGDDCRSSESQSSTFSAWSYCHTESKTVVAFKPHDPDHPNNWSKFWKIFVLVTGANEVMNSTVGSSVTGGATKAIAQEFGVTNQQILVLPISMFLVGYILGPLLWGPLSEAMGRRSPLLIAFLLYTVFMMASALAKSYPSLLIFRLLDGMAASAPIAVVGGIYADIEADHTARGRLMAYYMTATTIGPILGPLASGFLVSYGWRSCFWFGLAYAGISLPTALLMPETYAPIILKQRAKRLRKETGNSNIVSPLDLDSRDFKQTLAISLARPLRMLFYEPITSCSCLYLALTYAIFYLYFQAYPLVFQGIYGMGPAKSGLCFLPIGVGAVVACVIFIWYDRFLSRAKARNAKWAYIEEYRRLPLACLGGPLYVVAIFFMGWTAFPNVHWAIPALSGIPFGAGYLLNFMAMANYMADAYETYSASAMSASACTRSILGAMLPLATKPMFDRLGVNWAYTLVGFLSLGVTVIPFVFIRYGVRIRESSKFCQELKRLKEADARGPQTDRSVGRSGEISVIHVEPKDLENQNGR
ncbi:major facilitator superfamily domain-containing protein [Aspergillus tamarii]|uniref:Major facilitator superfamily domain-containing protein n=1 Tax=Aspergillus tamarii TaxID=41984 RepID=A0A5N6UQ04_ASPTM|nr:major facilitator superfamily domain-containing protein [Aspergillus tamarii]